MLKTSYNSRFFSAIHCLALVANEEVIRERMTKGRGITNNAWINDSIEYNEFLRSHDSIGDLKFERLNISDLSVAQVADKVISWISQDHR